MPVRRRDLHAWLGFSAVALGTFAILVMIALLQGCLSVAAVALEPALNEVKVLPAECKVFWIEGDEVTCIRWGPDLNTVWTNAETP